MIKILIIDDDTQKVQRILKALENVENFDISNVTHETNANSAKKRLETIKYDLMVLDIALPMRLDSEISPDGGIKLLDEILDREKYKKPSHIIGITAYPDLYQGALENFSKRLFSLLRFDLSTDDWEKALNAKVRHIILSHSVQTEQKLDFKCDLAIVCALDNPELSSILRLNWEWQQYYVPDDDTIYFRGEFLKGGEKFITFAAAASRMGMTATAILATKIITTFRPKYIAMTGITAGIPGKTRFGDIIVADQSWDYGSGKWVNIDGSLIFEPSPHQIQLTPKLKNKFRIMKNDTIFLAGIRNDWQGDRPENELSIHIGPLASGSAVIADGETALRVKAQHRGLIGLEMETYALFAAVEEATEPRPQCFSIKSVVDFADGAKDDRFQKYASYTSAQVLRGFVENYI